MHLYTWLAGQLAGANHKVRGSPSPPTPQGATVPQLTDADVVHAQEAVVDAVEPKLGADVAHDDARQRQVRREVAQLEGMAGWRGGSGCWWGVGAGSQAACGARRGLWCAACAFAAAPPARTLAWPATQRARPPRQPRGASWPHAATVATARTCTMNAWGPWSRTPPPGAGSIRRAITIACVAVLPRPPGHHLVDESVGLCTTNSCAGKRGRARGRGAVVSGRVARRPVPGFGGWGSSGAWEAQVGGTGVIKQGVNAGRGGSSPREHASSLARGSRRQAPSALWQRVCGGPGGRKAPDPNRWQKGAGTAHLLLHVIGGGRLQAAHKGAVAQLGLRVRPDDLSQAGAG